MIYFDNSATTAVKPKSVIKTVNRILKTAGGNPGRGGHILSQMANDEVYKARETVADFFNIDNPERVCFTNNATTALNFGIKGVLKENDHVIISAMEHNSVLRPIEKLKAKNISYDVLEYNENGQLNDIEKHIKPQTKLIVINHASNVTGDIIDIEKIGKIAKQKDIIFMVDASQSAGHIKIDVKKCNIDILALAGHKGLFGPQGTGVLYVKEGIIPDTVIEGGTGSLSELFTQPLIMPDRFESGTLNVPGIAGLKAGIDFINKTGIEKIRTHELELTNFIEEKLKKHKKITLYKLNDFKKRTGIISFNIDGWDSVVLSSYLNETGGFCTRGGLHCSYLAHKTLNTLDKGSLRLSFSVFNTLKEAEKFVSAIDRIA